MKLKLYLFVLIQGVSTLLMAQKSTNSPFKEVFGEKFKPKASNRVYDITGAVKIDKFYYVFGRQYQRKFNVIGFSVIPSDFVIYKLDNSMSVVSTSRVPAEFYGKTVESFKLDKVGENLVAFFIFNNKKQNKQYLFAQKYSLKNLQVVGKPIRLAEAMATKQDRKYSFLFTIKITPDHSKIIVTNDRSRAARTRREKKASRLMKNHTLSYWIFNENLEQINEVKDAKFGKGQTETIDQILDDKGNIYLLGFESKLSDKEVRKKGSAPVKKKKKDEDEDDDEDDNENVNKMVLKLIRNDGKTFDLKLAEKLDFLSAKLVLNKNTGRIAVVALLTGRKYGSTGIYTRLVDPENPEEGADIASMFSKEMVGEMEKAIVNHSSKWAKKRYARKSKKREAPDYIYNLVRMGDIYYTDSGELVVTAQKYYTYTVTTTTVVNGQRRTQTTTYYVYDDIYSFRLDNHGVIANWDIIPHYMETQRHIYRDYNSMYYKDKLYVFDVYSGVKVGLDNDCSFMKPFKGETARVGISRLTEFESVSDNEIMRIQISRRKILFSLLSVIDKS